MNFLLDTHAVIWFITDDKQLPKNIKNVIENMIMSALLALLLCGKWALSTH
jgi:PIN domain nuclease of toxin-antitoxin system